MVYQLLRTVHLADELLLLLLNNLCRLFLNFLLFRDFFRLRNIFRYLLSGLLRYYSLINNFLGDFPILQKHIIIGFDLVVDQHTREGVQCRVMHLSLFQGSSVPVRSLLVFRQFSVQKFQTQKRQRTVLFIGMEALEHLSDVHKRLDLSVFGDAKSQSQVPYVAGNCVTHFDVLLIA